MPCSLMDDHIGDGVFGVDFRTSTYMMGFSNNPIQLPLLQDGQPAAMVFFSPIDHLITKIEWRSK